MSEFVDPRKSLSNWWYVDMEQDEMFELITDDDYETLEIIVDKAMWILCLRLGHEMEDDVCGKPEHRFCKWCHMTQEDLDA